MTRPFRPAAMRPLLALLLLIVLVVPKRTAAQSPPPADADRAAVEAAVLDYVDALYDVDTLRVERSVHPELAKRGFARSREGGYRELKMTYAELHRLATTWNAAGRLDRARAPREVVVYDVLDQTATAKLTAAWGVDYLHLARYDGRWRIVNVLWQSPPPAVAAATGAGQ